MARSLVFAASCDLAAKILGGYERIDTSLEVVMQGLMVNPYAFPRIESDFYNARYIRTKPIRDIPSLIWLFQIEPNNDVLFTHVEEYERY